MQNYRSRTYKLRGAAKNYSTSKLRISVLFYSISVYLQVLGTVVRVSRNVDCERFPSQFPSQFCTQKIEVMATRIAKC